MAKRKKASLDTKFGNMAEGQIEINKYSKAYSGKGNLPFIGNNLLFPSGFNNAGIHVDISKGNVNGWVYIGEQKVAKGLGKSAEALELFGIQALDPVISSTVNTITKGELEFGIKEFNFSFGNALSGIGRFVLTNDGIDFAAGGTVSLKGLEGGGKLKLERTKQGLIKGDVDVQVALQKGKFAGALHVAYSGESFSGEGSIAYSSDKFSGKVNLRLMDAAAAKSLVEGGELPTEKAGSEDKAKTKKKARKPNYVVAGDGTLNFAFTDWLTGDANVVVSPEGHVKVIGEITPKKEIELFPEKEPFKKEFPAVSIEAAYGIPVVGKIGVFAGFNLSLWSKVGPGKLYNIRIQGEYSTDPMARQNYSVQASEYFCCCWHFIKRRNWSKVRDPSS